ncbi:MAG: ATP-binding cassette domain-containing protein [Candidatus Dadabacteria bacterium]|nr:MAG: ATP-binding cassette domain-containing protein [Candidatus Dadabacteria bacterium]
MIQAEDLTKDYGLNRAVDRVSFRIEKGDIVGLLGPNGSGKTTIMRMLTGFFAPTAGRCSIAGVDVTRDSLSARRLLGYLPERVALYPDMTVRRYLAFVAKVHEVPGRVDSYVDEAMHQCGLVPMADRHIGKLSRGYRQRVGIAQAIIHHPPVLILDEPTVGLDPRQVVEIRALIRSLAGRTTVLMSTHILPEVSITCRRVLILDRGRLIAEDTAEGLEAKAVGRGQLTVRLTAPAREAAEAIERVPGVSAVEIDGAEVGGVVRLLVTTDGAADRPEAVARAVAERGWALRELAPHTISLEDLFVKILEQAEAEQR